MQKALLAACALLALTSGNAFGRGVSPYLPLNLDPDIERQIERALILADKPILTRPIAAATVLDALPQACLKDVELCSDVRRYLARYMKHYGITHAAASVSPSDDTMKTLPNGHGETVASEWDASVAGFYQPSDHALVSLGAVAYQDEVVPTGSLLSLGFDRAQLDIGYRDHWWSPFADSAMLIGTEAATMPSVTLSSYVPLTRWGVHYEAFVAGQSKSDKIEFGGELTSGRPRLAGLHVSIEPAMGWALGINRLLQYGGGQRNGSFKDLLHAFFSPSRYDNTDPTLSRDQQFGNQLASITSELVFPGRHPFSVYFEYAGEDTSNGKNYLLGNSALSAGIRLPNLWRGLDLTFEVSEWQNAWYVNGVYGDGLTNKGHVIGHWGADDRQFGNDVGARSQMVDLAWQPPFGGTLELRYRRLANQQYFSVPYERAYDGTLRYSWPLPYITVGAEVFAGRNSFGEDFSRASVFVHLADNDPRTTVASTDYAPGEADESGELFVEAGAAHHKVRIDLDAISPTSVSKTSGRVGVGARRAVSDRSDLGARLELDSVDGHMLLTARAIDYRYRFSNPLALSVFIGASRYDVATPAYGISFGAGLQWRDILPGWDLGVDVRTAKKVARDHLLPGDPTSVRPDSFYTIDSQTLTLTKRF